MLLNCGVGKDSWESLRLQGDPTQSILQEISPEDLLEGLMLKLKLQDFGHLMWRTDSFEKTLMKAGEGDDRGWDDWMASPPRWTWVWVNSGSSWWTRRPGVLQFMGSQTVRHDWATDLIWSDPYLRVKFFLPLFLKLERINLWISLTIIISKCNLIPEETYKWIRLIK